MGFFAAIVVALVMAVVGELLRPKQKPPNAKASGLDDFDIPTAEEGRAIPVFAGKVRIDGSNVTWYGDLSATPVKKKVKTGWFSSTKQTIGHKYRLGMQMVIGWGGEFPVTVHEMLFGDAMPKHTVTDEGNGCTRITFNDEQFYGGQEKEGGIAGVARVYAGTDSQTANVYMATQVEEAFPAYKNLCHVILENMYLGMSSYIKTISYIVSRYPNQLGLTGGRQRIGDDCNPICFIYEAMTDQVWGVGVSTVDIDLLQFRAVANKIFDEGYGMSMTYNGGSTARDMCEDILRHIDGVMFSDPETGLITIRLARADYVVEDLPVLGETEFQQGIQFSRPSWSETRNTIKSNYIDRDSDFMPRSLQMQDLANITQRGGEVSMEELDFTGFSTYEPAALATARALKTLSYPLGKLAGSLDRRFWKVRPADVFVINWPKLGIESVVMRVIRVSYKNLASNMIDVEMVEDIFAISRVAYIAPEPTGWVNPVSDPTAMTAQRLIEAPAFNAPSSARFVITMGAKEQAADVAYDVYRDLAGGTAYTPGVSVEDYTPSGILATAMPLSRVDDDVSGIAIANVIGLDLVDAGSPTGIDRRDGRNLIIIGNEWIAWKSMYYDPGTEMLNLYYTLSGVLDTVPEEHNPGDRVWFVSEGAGTVDEDGYDTDMTMRVKLLPRSIRGALPIADAVPMLLTTNARAMRPIVPGKFRINGGRPALISGSISNQFTVAWAHRNRFYQNVVSQSDDSLEPEEGTLYNMRIYNNDTNALIVARTDMNGTTATVRMSAAANVRVELTAVIGSTESWAKQTAVFAYLPAGSVVNEIIPDEPTYILDGGGA